MKYSIYPSGLFFPDNCSWFSRGIPGIITPSPGDKGWVTLPVVIPALGRNLGQVSHKSPVLHVPTSRSHIPKLRNILGMGFPAFLTPFPTASGAEPGSWGSAPQGRTAKSPKFPQILKILGIHIPLHIPKPPAFPARPFQGGTLGQHKEKNIYPQLINY